MSTENKQPHTENTGTVESAVAPKKTPLYKQPAVIIFVLFIGGFFLVKQFATQMISDEPLVLSNPKPEIIMYGTQSCGYCIIAKAFFKKHNLPYTEHDIEKSEKSMQMFYLLGGRGTPLVIINKEIIHGFDERLMRKALKKQP